MRHQRDRVLVRVQPREDDRVRRAARPRSCASAPRRSSVPRIMIVCGLPASAAVISRVAIGLRPRRRRRTRRRERRARADRAGDRAGGQEDDEHRGDARFRPSSARAGGRSPRRRGSRGRPRRRAARGSPPRPRPPGPCTKSHERLAVAGRDEIETHSSGPWWPAPTGPNSTAGTPASRKEIDVGGAVAADAHRALLAGAAHGVAEGGARTGCCATRRRAGG